MADTKDWSSLSKADPEFEEAVRTQFGGKAPQLTGFPDIPKMRQVVKAAKEKMTQVLGGNVHGVTTKDHQIPVRDGNKIACRSYHPTGSSQEECPVYVVFHGGGWCLGGLENEELLCRLLTAEVGAVCFNVDYRLAPEHAFPTAPNDCFDATQWIVSNSPELGANPSKGLIINGTSAGGNLAVTVCHQWHDKALQPPVTGCHLMNAPSVYYKAVPEQVQGLYKSWGELEDAPVINHAIYELLIEYYVPREQDRYDPLFSPMLKPNAAGIMPPTYQQVSGMDIFRDEQLIFDQMMREAGRESRVDVYAGLPHGFWSFMPTLKATQEFFKDAEAGAKWLLKQ